MKKLFFKDAFGWGVGLWLIGYILGIILFFVVPPTLLGWVIMPIGVIITLWVLVKRIKSVKLSYYVIIGIVWTVLAIIFDYLFLVQVFHPEQYYTVDIYLYYALTFLLPVVVGWWKDNKQHAS